LGIDNPVPVPSVNEQIMVLVKEYAEYKVENPNPPPSEDKKDERRTDDILPWDKEFMGKLEQSQLFDLIMVRISGLRPSLVLRRRPFLFSAANCKFLTLFDLLSRLPTSLSSRTCLILAARLLLT
jgi:hypothetical protein